MQEESIFIEALEKQDPGERAAFLTQVCAGNADLRQRIERLLQRHERADSLLDSPVVAQIATLDEPIKERPGTVIGPYKLLEQIGEGGFGVVFMAEQQQPVRRKVALKVIKPGMDTRQVIARFEAERQALALMDHPNIARVLDAGSTADSEPAAQARETPSALACAAGSSGRPYFVMELVRGPSMTDYCDQHNLPVRERLELFIDVCQAVQHAHQKGIIHRDIKPSNVLVTLHDGKPVVKVIDFGIAKAMGQQLTEKTLFTNFAQMIGTPLYMSPEQAEMSGLDVDTRSDIYSLGVLLYELLTGTTPFDKERLKQAGFDEIRRIIREEEPPKPSTRMSTVGQAATTASEKRQSDPHKLSRLFRGELDWIVMKALEKDRNRRYETASALAADVGRYLKDEAVQACPPSGWYRFRKFARRNKRTLVTVALLGGVVLAAVASIAGTLGWAARERSVRQAILNSEVELAMQEADRARDLALTQTYNPYQWEATLATALAALKRAEGIAAQDEFALDLAVGERLHALRATLDGDENDRRFVARFEEIRLEQAELDPGTFQYQYGKAFPAIREAFQAYYRVDFGTAPAATVVNLIQQRPRPIQEHLLDALELSGDQETKDYLQVRPWLDAVLKAADSDPWRQRKRTALAARDWPALERLVNDGIAARRPPASLYWLVVEIPVDVRSIRIGLLRRVQVAHPGDFWVNYELAVSLGKSVPAQWDEAIRYLTAALALRPRDMAVYRSLGVALMEKGDLDAAIATFQQALAVNPDDASVHNSLGNAIKRKGNPEAAIAEYRRAIALQPRYSAPHGNLGDALNDKGLLDEAIACFHRAIELDSKNVSAHNSLGSVLAHQNKLDDAIACYRLAIALDLDPKHAEPHYNLANALRDQGKLEEAIEEYNKAITLKPGSAEAYSNLGIALRKQGKLDEAIIAYKKAIQLRPDYHGTHYDLGIALRKNGKLDEAIAAYKEAIRLKPEFALAHNNLGIALKQKGFLEEAIASYGEAIRLKRDYVEAHNNLAWLLATAPDRKYWDSARAIELAKTAIQWAPMKSSGWNTLGAAHYRAGNWKESVAGLEKSMELSKGGDSTDWFFLAMAHWQLGNKDEARKWYDRAVEWMEKNKPKDEELLRFRAEAADLMGVEKRRIELSMM